MIVKDEHRTYLGVEAISASYLKQLIESPQKAINGKFEFKKAFNFGTAYHKYILENSTYFDEVTVLDEANRPDTSKGMTAKVNKEWEDELRAKASTLITQQEQQYLEQMQEALFRNNKYVKLIIANGISEASLYTDIEINHKIYKAKARFDCILPEQGIILDLKTTSGSASPNGWAKEVVNFNYHMQAAWYCMLAEAHYGRRFTMYFAAQEKKHPFDSSLSVLSEEFTQQGLYMVESAIGLHDTVQAKGTVPSYEVFSTRADGVIEVAMPAYARKVFNINKAI